MLFTDQTGNTINLSAFPKRIVSLVPSQTELLYELGLEEEVVGITKFCTRPQKWFRNKLRAGGTKTVNIELIKKLQPDLVIANKEENVHEQVQQLQQAAPVWVSDIKTLEDALEMITTIGSITNRQEQAGRITIEIQSKFAQLQTTISITKPINVAYLIWQNPYMTAGGDTFIHDMLSRCGLTNVFESKSRYPVVTIEELTAANCHTLLLSSEPYPFTQKHVHQMHDHLPGAAILLADGEMFSWYGSRLLHAAAYFTKLIDEILSNRYTLAYKKSTIS